MARIHCLACRGRYDRTSADGVPYAHVCPPVFSRQVIRAGDRVDIGASEPEPADITTKTTTLPRPNARDENPIDLGDGRRGIVAEGAGILEADDDDALDELVAQHEDARTRAATAVHEHPAPELDSQTQG